MLTLSVLVKNVRTQDAGHKSNMGIKKKMI